MKDEHLVNLNIDELTSSLCCDFYNIEAFDDLYFCQNDLDGSLILFVRDGSEVCYFKDIAQACDYFKISWDEIFCYDLRVDESINEYMSNDLKVIPVKMSLRYR